MSQKVVTRYKVNVVEYDRTGYYLPKYKTEQVVIADSLDEAYQKSFDRTPMKHSSSDWTQYAELIEAEDIIMEVSEE